MRASDLIFRLADIINKHGDLPLLFKKSGIHSRLLHHNQIILVSKKMSDKYQEGVYFYIDKYNED